jgi:hypothetical protein
MTSTARAAERSLRSGYGDRNESSHVVECVRLRLTCREAATEYRTVAAHGSYERGVGSYRIQLRYMCNSNQYTVVRSGF